MDKKYQIPELRNAAAKRWKSGGTMRMDLNPACIAAMFKTGRYILAGITMEQMQDRVKGKWKSLAFRFFLAGLFTKKYSEVNEMEERELKDWKNYSVILRLHFMSIVYCLLSIVYCLLSIE